MSAARPRAALAPSAAAANWDGRVAMWLGVGWLPRAAPWPSGRRHGRREPSHGSPARARGHSHAVGAGRCLPSIALHPRTFQSDLAGRALAASCPPGEPGAATGARRIQRLPLYRGPCCAAISGARRPQRRRLPRLHAVVMGRSSQGVGHRIERPVRWQPCCSVLSTPSGRRPNRVSLAVMSRTPRGWPTQGPHDKQGGRHRDDAGLARAGDGP
jgi:hypothetical protein